MKRLLQLTSAFSSVENEDEESPVIVEVFITGKGINTEEINVSRQLAGLSDDEEQEEPSK